MEACRDPPCHAKHQPRQNESDGHWHLKDVVDPTSLEEGEDTIHQEGAGQKDGEGECQVSESTLTILLWRPSPLPLLPLQTALTGVYAVVMPHLLLAAMALAVVGDLFLYAARLLPSWPPQRSQGHGTAR